MSPRRRRAAAAVGLAWLAGCSGADRSDELRAVMLITLDTTRADALGCYGGPAGVTPHLDRLAAEGVCFDAARTVVPLTLPAHCSMLTGLYPPRHTVRVNGSRRLPAAATTAAELAREAGFATGAFVSAVVLDRRFGLDQGFDHYDQPAAPAVQLERHYERRPGSEVVDAALAWLAARDPARPVFAWLHFFEPHAPYEPAPRFAAQAGGDPYLGEVAAMDDELGRFLAGLRAHGLWEDALVLVVADHGEGLQDHGEDTHGSFLFDTTMRVPLVLRDPRAADEARGTRATTPVSVVDVFATLVEAFGGAAPRDVDGVPLGRRDSADPGVYLESYQGFYSFGWRPVAGWATAERKLIAEREPIVFDLAADPGETRNAAASAGAHVAALEAAIARVAGADGLEPEELGGGDPRLMRTLEGLGYAGAGATARDVPHPLEPSDRPSPHARIAEQAAFQRAEGLMATGRAAEAVPILEELVAANPYNHSAYLKLGSLLLGQRRYADAIAALHRNLELRGSWHGVHMNLGIGYEATGDVERALEHYRAAVAHEPGLDRILQQLVRLLTERGEHEEARRYLRQYQANQASGGGG